MKNSQWLLKITVGLAFLLLMLPGGVQAREGGNDFTREELAQMLAPVALYPDSLLSQVLMAATYPLEVVEADRWLRKNSRLKGDNLDEALRDKDWDPSVKALCHVPAILGLMSERLEDTTRLGDAFLAQEKEVMETIQDLRVRAMREGNLKSDDKQKVTVLEDGTIVIEPADPKVVYVPYYNTRYVYGPWWYPAWPPWYWGPGEIVVAGGGIFFWPDFFFGLSFGWCYFDWHDRVIIINARQRPGFVRPDYDWASHGGGWRHLPQHRRGVVYRSPVIAERYSQPPERVRQAEQKSTRGRVRGPVTGGGTSGAEAGRLRKSGETAGPAGAERKRAERAPDSGAAGAVAGQPRSREGAGAEVRRPERVRPERRGNETVVPPVGPAGIEPVAPAPPQRERGGEVRRDTVRERERDRTPVYDEPARTSEPSRPERGSGREGRSPGTQERGGQPFGDYEGRGEWGGRRR